MLTSQTRFFMPPATSNHLFITGTWEQFIEQLHTIDPSAPSCSLRTPSVHLTSRVTFMLHREPLYFKCFCWGSFILYRSTSNCHHPWRCAAWNSSQNSQILFQDGVQARRASHTDTSPTTLATLISIIVDENLRIYHQISSCSNLKSLCLNLCNLDKLHAICYSPTTSSPAFSTIPVPANNVPSSFFKDSRRYHHMFQPKLNTQH